MEPLIQPIELELIESIYHALSDHSHWPIFVERLACAVRCQKGSLIIHDVRCGWVGIEHWIGWHSEDVRLYSSQFASEDLWTIRTAQIAEGEVVTNHDIGSAAELEASPAFRHFYAPRSCYYGVYGAILRSDADRASIMLARRKDDGPFNEKELAIIRHLLPHLRRAAILRREASSSSSRLTAFSTYLHRYPHGFLLADRERQVLHANSSALEILRRGDGLRLEQGRLLASASRNQLELEAAAVAVESNSCMRRLCIPRRLPALPYRVTLMTASSPLELPPFSRPTICILIVDPGRAPEVQPEVLQEMFSLTSAEALIAVALAYGKRVAEIALERGISIQTVRTHVHRVLSKTGTRRQSEFAVLALRAVPLS